MWKWILGGACLLIVVLGATCWYGMKMLTAGGGSAVVTIAGSPDRVFASLANTDSLSTWMLPGNLPTFEVHGVLSVGDSLEMRAGNPGRPAGQPMVWRVTEVVPGRLLAMRAFDPTGRAMISRRDSLTAVGDSTLLVSTFGSPMMDSLRAKRGDTAQQGGMLEQVLVSAMRLAASVDLERLKSRIEGKTMPADTGRGGRSIRVP